MQERPDISITTTHSYVIEHKFRWRCRECAVVFGRHSRSIDVDKVGCGCGGRLVELGKDGNVAAPRSEKKQSAWQAFMAVSVHFAPIPELGPR